MPTYSNWAHFYNTRGDGMDINFLHGLGTVFAMIAFVSICIWAYSGKRKKDFDEAAQLPFDDEQDNLPDHEVKR